MVKVDMDSIVSIIIPIHNNISTLARCVNSVLCQTYQKIEIILIDDGSNDDSFEICKEYATKDRRVKIFHKENGGASSARNLGLENAHGEYVFFVDADDTIDSGLIGSLVNKAEEDNGSTLVGSQINIINGLNSKMLKCVEVGNSHSLIIRRLLDGDLQGFACGYLFKRGSCPKFEERVGYCEDILFVVDYLNMNDISNIIFSGTEGFFYNYYQDTGGVTTTNKDILKKISDINLSMQLLKERLDVIYHPTIDNRKDELVEAELQHASYGDIKEVLMEIKLPQYTGKKKNVSVFCSLYRKKNASMLRGYYISRACVKKIYLCIKRVFR